MSRNTDSTYLLGDQYKDAGNLNARIDLHARFSTNPCGWFRWLFEQLRLSPVCRILDLGCGPGKMWWENRQHIPRGWSLCLSDFSVGMVVAAKHALAAVPNVFSYQIIDAQRLPLRDGTFNCVIANHMLYHVPDRSRALHEIARVLTPGGCLIASTVGDNHLKEIDKQLGAVGVSQELLGRSMSRTFTLENGAAQLRSVFGEVTLYRYADALEVTEIDPLMAYVRSMGSAHQMSAASLERVRAHFAAEIERHGAARISKDSGLFVARGAAIARR